MPRNEHRWFAIASRSALTPPDGAIFISSSFLFDMTSRETFAHTENGKLSGSVPLFERSQTSEAFSDATRIS